MLRDYFAGLALNGILASEANFAEKYKLIGKIAYEIADAMLEAKEKYNA